MKSTILLPLLLVSISLQSHAQQYKGNYDLYDVSASDVPAMVIDAFNDDFKASVIKWQKGVYTGTKKSTTRYIAVFDLEGLRTRARYQEDGKGISYSSFYIRKTVGTLPEEVKEFWKSNYPDWLLPSAEHIRSLLSEKEVYRLRMRQGSKKLVAYVDESGKELERSSLSQELTEGEKQEISN
jgi:hypothetical protein